MSPSWCPPHDASMSASQRSPGRCGGTGAAEDVPISGLSRRRRVEDGVTVVRVCRRTDVGYLATQGATSRTARGRAAAADGAERRLPRRHRPPRGHPAAASTGGAADEAVVPRCFRSGRRRESGAAGACHERLARGVIDREAGRRAGRSVAVGRAGVAGRREDRLSLRSHLLKDRVLSISKRRRRSRFACAPTRRDDLRNVVVRDRVVDGQHIGVGRSIAASGPW